MKSSRISLKPRARQRTRFSQKQIAIAASSIVACLSICLFVFFNTTSNTEVKAGTGMEYLSRESTEFYCESTDEPANFDAVTQGESISFFWNTATQTQNDSFTVERSSDGKEYSAVAKVKGENKKARYSYSAADKSPLSGVTYYRLKQTDTNGIDTYSPVKAVKNSDTEDSKFSLHIDDVYPARFVDHFVLQYSAKKNAPVILKIMTPSGELLYRENLKPTRGSNEYVFPAGIKLRSGAYIATLSCGNDQVATEIVKD